MDQAGVDILLVGDSVGMVVHGHDTTLPVTLEDMLLHCRWGHGVTGQKQRGQHTETDRANRRYINLHAADVLVVCKCWYAPHYRVCSRTNVLSRSCSGVYDVHSVCCLMRLQGGGARRQPRVFGG